MSAGVGQGISVPFGAFMQIYGTNVLIFRENESVC